MDVESRIKWACTRKRKYTTKNRALHYASLSAKRTGEELKPYKCEYCRLWHIGHDKLEYRNTDRSIARRRYFKIVTLGKDKTKNDK